MAKNAEKTEAPAKVKKPRRKLSVILKQFRSDIKKITWPSGKTVLRNTVMVLVVMIVVAALIGVIDLGLTKLLELIVS